MKNENNKNVHAPLKVKATLDEFRFLQGLLENLADRKKGRGFSNKIIPEDYFPIDLSSVEAYISGDIRLLGEDSRITAPYITGFLFTCTKNKGGTYGMTWISSLS